MTIYNITIHYANQSRMPNLIFFPLPWLTLQAYDIKNVLEPVYIIDYQLRELSLLE